MSKNNGGAAFPSHGTMGEVLTEGMSLREYFAGQAMQSLLSNPDVLRGSELAASAYICADAMIAEGAK